MALTKRAKIPATDTRPANQASPGHVVRPFESINYIILIHWLRAGKIVVILSFQNSAN